MTNEITVKPANITNTLPSRYATTVAATDQQPIIQTANFAAIPRSHFTEHSLHLCQGTHG